MRNVTMRLRFGVLVVGLVGLLAGCSGAISGSIAKDIGKNPPGDLVVKGIQNASFNLDSAITIGALPKNDPAAKCLHEVMTQLGIDPAAPSENPSFDPRVSDLISAGSVLYIRAQQLKSAQGGVSLPESCEALIGRIMIDAARAGRQALPGAGIRLFK